MVITESVLWWITCNLLPTDCPRKLIKIKMSCIYLRGHKPDHKTVDPSQQVLTAYIMYDCQYF